MEGWIKIDRKILEWEWWTDQNTFRVFMYFLLRANWETQRYKGIEVPKGSFISGRKQIAKETGLSENEVRTAIKHLESTNEITKQRIENYTVFTVVKWNQYQSKSPEILPNINQPLTNPSPQYKNNKKIRNKDVYSEKPNVVKTNKFNNFPQRDIDYDDIEKKLQEAQGIRL